MLGSLTGSQVKLAAAPVGVAVVEIVGPSSPPAPHPARERKQALKTIAQAWPAMDFGNATWDERRIATET